MAPPDGKLLLPGLSDAARSALVVATTSYLDPSLSTLRAPAVDATGFAGVLADPGIGGFDVRTVIDAPVQEVRVAIEEFLGERHPDDLVVVYLSCHGLKDLRRRLYFAASDTSKTLLASTGIDSTWVMEQMDQCRARSQILILDCCFSGAFALGFKGDDEMRLDELMPIGRGRAILTASNAREYSFEGTPVEGSLPNSVFTGVLLEGLRSGAADSNGDGFITVDEAYEYAFREVRAKGVNQTPQKWLSGGEGELFLARSPAGQEHDSSGVPRALREQLEHSRPDMRIAAVQILKTWVDSGNAELASAARATLEFVIENDIPRVSSAARLALGQPLVAARVQDADHEVESFISVPAEADVTSPGTSDHVNSIDQDAKLDYIRNKRFRMARKSGYEVLEVDEFIDWIEEQYVRRLDLLARLRDSPGSVNGKDVEDLLVTREIMKKRFRMARKSAYEVLEVDEFMDEMEELFVEQDERIKDLWRG
jgi:DivIVA domain-containing protein